MKDDLISRQAAIDKMMDLYNEDVEQYGVPIPEGFDGHRAVEAIKEIPPAEPERKQGEWIVSKSPFPQIKPDKIVCSVCGAWQRHALYKFCPHCGADMRGSDNDG